MINTIYKNILDVIGNTPVIEISKIKEKNMLENDLYIKLESKNPGGSIKDRIAYNMIKHLYESGKINDDTIILEVTSGNTGIGLAMVCAYYNIKLAIIINEGVTRERLKLLEMYGAKIIKMNKNKKMDSSIYVAKQLASKFENIIYIDQFSNINNSLAHYNSTAEEIILDFENGPDYMFLGMGSTGTIMGVSEKIKKINENINIIGVESCNCPYYKENKIGDSDIPGIGSSFIPYIYNKKYVDDIVLVDKEYSIQCVSDLMKVEGISLGISSGAAIGGAIKYLKENNIKGKRVLIVCPDSIDKYLSII